jgi:gluconolactonase
MRLRIVLACVLVPALAHAQGSASLLPGERAAVVAAIPGVIAADAKWELIWADFETADGIVGTADGGVLFAQEQTDTIRRLDVNGKEYVFVKDSFGAGSISMDAQGRLFAAQRACTDTARPFAASCPELPAIAMVYPQRRTLANMFKDGRPLGRPNDLMADGKGGAYFTAGGAYHVNADGVVTVVEDQNLRSNGIMLSPDGKTLYVTNQKVVIAFDVKPPRLRRTQRRRWRRRHGGRFDGAAVCHR